MSLPKRANTLFALFLCAAITAVSSFSIAQNNQNELPQPWQQIFLTAVSENWHSETEWRRLVHYKCVGEKCLSQQDGPYFFLAKDGKRNPSEELKQTIIAFSQNSIRSFNKQLPSQSAICQFPARLQYLAKKSGSLNFTELMANCEKYHEFSDKFSKDKISLVFSSYYLNNPSSSFGHTLLKIDRKGTAQGKSADLLAYGINYAALPTTRNPVAYAILGIIGGFKGAFAFLPYYYKVREYNDFETRDIWEYELNLKSNEIQQVINHIWELGFADFDYYYFTENCSYYMVKLLDAAVPRLNLVDQLPYWVIPSDTIKAAYNTPGLVSNINHRPSMAVTLQQRYENLSPEEKIQFEEIKKNYQLPKNISARLLDALIDQFDIEHSQQLLDRKSQVADQKHQLLVKRSQLSQLPIKIQSDFSEAPHLAHESFQWVFSAGARGASSNVKSHLFLTSRFSFHDLIDPVQSLPRYARLEMFATNFSYNLEQSELNVDRFRFVGIEALNSWDRLWKNPAWRFDLGAERITDDRCDNCFSALAGGSYGYSIELPYNGFSISPFAYLNLRARLGRFIKDDISGEFGPSLGLRILSNSNLNALIEIEQRNYSQRQIFSDLVTSTRIQKSIDDRSGLQLSLSTSEKFFEAKLGFVVFN